MESKKSFISAEKEYDALRQEMLKRIEMQYTLLNVILTIFAAMIGFGINNNKIAFLIPPVMCLLSFVWKNTGFMILRISEYIIEKFEGEHLDLGWETYNRNKSSQLFSQNKLFFFSIGPFGILISSSLIAILVGLFNFQASSLEILLLTISLLSLFSILLLFGFYNSEKLRKMAKRNI